MSGKLRALTGGALVACALTAFAAQVQAEVAGPPHEQSIEAKLDKLHRVRPIAARTHVPATRPLHVRAQLALDAAKAGVLTDFHHAVELAQLRAFYDSVARQQLAAFYEAAGRQLAEQQAAAAAAHHRRASVPWGAHRAGGGDGTLACIRRHESDTSGGYQAINRSSGAGGAYQALPSTWAGYAGYARAQDAPPDVQDRWAREAIASAGTRPWAGSGC